MNTLEDIKARLAAATPGPWEMLGGGEYINPVGITVAPDDGGVTSSDAEFIANAPADIAHMIAALEAARSIPPLSDRENGDEMFLLGWEAAMEEVNARINEHLGES